MYIKSDLAPLAIKGKVYPTKKIEINNKGKSLMYLRRIDVSKNFNFFVKFSNFFKCFFKENIRKYPLRKKNTSTAIIAESNKAYCGVLI